MSARREYEGESLHGTLQLALEGALQQLAEELGKDGAKDASASWVVTKITGNLGGWDRPRVKVKIAAERVPEWGLS